jgi:hypothetical protein
MADDVQSYPFASGTPNAAWLTGGTAAGDTSSTTVGQYGKAQGSTAEYWLPIWSGEVLNAYDQYNIFEPLVTTRAITSGTTMRFPITGTVGHKAQWKAGEELEGSTSISQPGWFDISLDQRPMASYFELDDISLMLTQWEYRAELARQAGLSLANARDKQIACLIAQAAFMPARNPAVSKGGNFAGATTTSDLSSSSYDMPAAPAFNHLGHASATQANRTAAALLLLEYIEKYMVRLQEIDAPTDGVYVAVTPRAFQDIRALGVARSSDNPLNVANLQPMFAGVAAAGGLGAPYTQGMNALTDTLTYMGATIIKTNHLLQRTVELGGTDYTVADSSTEGQIDTELDNIIVAPGGGTQFTPSDLEADKITDLGDAKYNFDWLRFSTAGAATTGAAPGGFDAMFPVKALIWQRDAVASLSLQGMKVDTIRDVRRNTQFTVASVMRGGGVLRPELCAAICGSTLV